MKFPRLHGSITKAHWPLILLYAGVFSVLGCALFWQLSTLVTGYSLSELVTYRASQQFTSILHNPINAPFLLIVKGLSLFRPESLLVTRLASSGLGVLVLGVFALLLRRWHGKWTAVIGTMLFGLSAWFLHISRLGTPEVLLFGVFLLTAAGFWLRKTNHWAALLSCFVIVAALLYVPGMLWFVGLGLLWQWKTIKAVLQKHTIVVAVGGVLLLAGLVPLAWALSKDHSLIMPLLGLPAHWPTPVAMLENLAKVPFHLFVRNEADPVTWLGTAPILDVFSLTMFIVGAYVYVRHFRLIRTPLFVALFALTIFLMAMGSSITFTVILPFIYLIIAAGVSRFIDLWLVTFPRNPIARSVGWIGISLIVTLACSYQLTHYFLGWPHASATHEVFIVK